MATASHSYDYTNNNDDHDDHDDPHDDDDDDVVEGECSLRASSEVFRQLVGPA